MEVICSKWGERLAITSQFDTKARWSVKRGLQYTRSQNDRALLLAVVGEKLDSERLQAFLLFYTGVCQKSQQTLADLENTDNLRNSTLK